MNEIEYSQLARHITEKLDNTAEYELWLIIQEYIEQLKQENQQLKEQYSKLEEKYLKQVSCCNEEDCELYRELQQKRDVIDKLMVNWNFLEKYLDENKMVLNNPSIFQFYLIQKEILQKWKGDNK